MVRPQAQAQIFREQAIFFWNAQKKRQAISRLSFQSPITLLTD